MASLSTLKRTVVAGIAAGFMALAPVNAPSDTGFGHYSAQAASKFSAKHAISRINAVRAKHNLKPLKLDERLMQAAHAHAKMMGETGVFAHRMGRGTSLRSRVRRAGFRNDAGENLAAGYNNIDGVIEGWLKSPGHRRILLKRKYGLGGIAFHRNVSGKNKKVKHFWVLIAGSDSIF